MASCFCFTHSSSSRSELPKPAWPHRYSSCFAPVRAGWWWMWRRRQMSEPVISIHQVQPGADGVGECLWQRNILMGEKCALPDFSGAIVYNLAGKLIAPGRPRLVSALQ